MYANYQTDDTGRLINATTYPLDESKPMICLPLDFEWAYLHDYVVRDGEAYHDPAPTPEPTSAEQIAALKAKLAATDYAIIKIAEGAATAEEYADTIALRQEWRDKINALEAQEGGKL